MAAAAARACGNTFTFHGFSCLTSQNINTLLPVSSIVFPQSFQTIKYSRLRISQRTTNQLGCIHRLKRINCLEEDNPEAQNSSPKEASVDIKLPRRSLLVSFTCNACGVRSQRLINRVAYEKGTVFLQCAGCLQYHKFVDNLGLVVEYNFVEDGDKASNGDET